MPAFTPGLALAHRYYTHVVAPLLGDRPHIAARIGPGSDVLGYDGPRSTDHDWGPRLDLFCDDHGLTDELRHRLPAHFEGWPTHFTPAGARVRSMTETDGPIDHYVTVTPFRRWIHDHLRCDPAAMDTRDWLTLPWQRLAEITGGAVFHDPAGELHAVRDRLRWYPDDVWRHVLAAQWARIGEEEAFVGRTAEAGDELGSRLTAARLARDVARLLLLLDRRWPPYQKWLTTAIRTDPATPMLTTAITTADPDERQDALCTAYEEAARRQNALALCDPVQPTRRPYFDRGYPVIGAGRFTAALRTAITDPELATRPVTGSIDQISDNTEFVFGSSAKPSF
ncbi:DUF4037 domain-containing protein [Actinoplanes sp. NPDC051851]|uniref:DUF4037 domain-containing protein n=1 Tax=Actinoplanes sp. NPDC051851 TaxID=3154753 RepID=UPI0034351088